MNKWFFGKHILEKEQRRLNRMDARREWNSRLIQNEQAQLRAGLKEQLSGVQGLTLSFGAGCAAALAFKNREHLAKLKGLPWDEIAQLLQLYAMPEGEPMRGTAQMTESANQNSAG